MGANYTTHARRYGTDTGAQETLIEMASLIGHKWYPVILHRLCVEDDRGFSDLHDEIDGISNKMLSDSLSALEERGLVDRDVVADKPVRVQYSLTDRGRDLEDVLAALLDWGRTNLQDGSTEPQSAATATPTAESVATAAVASGDHAGGHGGSNE